MKLESPRVGVLHHFQRRSQGKIALPMNDLGRNLQIASRMAYIEPFEVMEIQTLARALEAQGRDVIHLEIGEPDFTTPRPVVQAAQRALESRPMFYTSALGTRELREAVARIGALLTGTT